MTSLERARRAPDGVVVVDDNQARAFARSRDVCVEERVVHPPDDALNRHSAGRHVGAGEFPVPEMSGDQDDSLPCRVRLLNALEALGALEQVQHTVAAELRE